MRLRRRGGWTLLLALVVAAGAAFFLLLRERPLPSPPSGPTLGSRDGPGLSGMQPATKKSSPSPSPSEADPTPKWTVRGIVRLAGSATGGRGTRVHLRVGDGRDAVASETASGEAFELAFDAPRELHRPALRLGADGYVSRAIPLTEKQTDLGEILLVRGQAYRGRILDADGSPLEGVRVFLRRNAMSIGAAPATSDTDGNFALSLAGDGMSLEHGVGGVLGQCALFLTAPGRVLGSVPADVAGLVSRHVFRLPMESSGVALLIRRPDLAPAAGAEVAVLPVVGSARSTGPRGRPAETHGSADEQGRFLPQWPAWRPAQLARITDGKEKPRAYVLELERVKRTQPYPISLGARERTVELRVRNEAGKRLVQARVTLHLPLPGISGVPGVDLQGVTDADGHVAWVLGDTDDASFRMDRTGMMADVWYVDRDGGCALAQGEVAFAIADRDVAATLVVRLSDQPSEKPIWVHLAPALERRAGRPLEMLVEWTSGDSSSSTVVGRCARRTPLEGDLGARLWPMLELYPPDGVVMDACSAWVRFDTGISSRFALSPAAWTASVDSRTPLVLSELPAIATLEVTATDEHGEPIPNALVTATCTDGSTRTRPVSKRLVAARTNGTAVISSLPGGLHWYVHVDAPDGGASGGADVGRVVGTRSVTVRSEAVKAFWVRVVLPDGSVPEKANCLAKPREPGPGLPRRARYDPRTGKFALAALPHSLYDVELTAFVTERLSGGRYRTLRYVGGGPMADVAYKAIQLALEKPPNPPSAPAPPK